MTLAPVAIVTGSAVAGIVAVAIGNYLDDDQIRPATAGARNRHHNE